MAKFKDLRYRDGFLTLGNKELRVDKKDLTSFIQGIAMSASWPKDTKTNTTFVCNIGDYAVNGSIYDNKLHLLVSTPQQKLFTSALIASNMDSFKDKKQVEASTLTFRLIQYLSQFL